MLKQCVACSELKSLEEFNKNKYRSDGLQDRCRPCDNDRARSYYQSNKARLIKQINDAQKVRSKGIKDWLCQYLIDHPCVDCGERDIIVLEFDHLSDKSMNISRMLYGDFSIKAIEKEIAKCEVVCANCHKRRTDKRAGNYRSIFLESMACGEMVSQLAVNQ